MRKAFLSVIGTLFGVLGVLADNISVADVTIESGHKARVSICLDNTETDLVTFQMDLTLPKGITVNKAKSSLSNRFSDTSQELTIGKQGDDTFRLTSTSLSLKPIKGTSGEIITLWLSASETAASGTAVISNIRLGTSNSERITLDDVRFGISVVTPSPVISFADAMVKSICVRNWDTNDDGELSEAEAAAVKELGTMFKGNTSIQSFDELRYFTGLSNIGNDAFRLCTRLNSVTIPNNVTSIGSNAFRGCNGFTSVTIPDNVISIGDNAFRECGNLMRINIGSGVKNIGSMAFGACTEMSEVYCYATSVPTTASDAFNQSYAKAATLYVHATSIPDYQSTNPWDKFGTIRSLPDEVFTLTYMVDGSVFKTYRLEYGATITPEAAPTKEGHTFSGWSDIPETMPAHDVTVTGTFTVNKYKLIFMVDGVEYKSMEVEYGASITPETAPVKEGYTFSGWSGIPGTMPAHDVTVTGSFTVNKYKLTYIVDGAEYKSMEVEYGATITPEAEPIKEGYTFSGWSGIPETMPAHDVTVTGSFTINKYKLTYIVDDTEYKSFEIEFGAKITPEAEPIKEGYTFSGWSGIPETMPAHDVTVTGSFTINKYKLTYMVDGAEYKSYEIEFGATIMPEAEPKKEGYTFSGWGEIPETMPAHEVTVTGSFTINKYKLTYIVDNTEYKSFEIEFGAKITPEAEPIKEGYTFSGWSGIPETMPAHDVIVTGSFTINKYKLTYMVDGVEYKSMEVEYGATITPEAEPVKEGYTFSGWSEIPETMPAHDVTVTGSFTVNRYKLTYMVDGAEYKSYEIEFGATIMPEAEPKKEGYTFSGWGEIPETMPAHDVTVTGSFTINKYKLTYMVDGAEYKSYEIEFGATIMPEAEPVKEGYTFSGWGEIPETMPAHDVTVTGSFTINKYKLTYMVDGAEYKSYEIEFGVTIMPEAEPKKEGYTFSGWGEIPETMPAHDVTVTGSFTVNKYKLTYVVDGTEYKSMEVEYGATITPEAEPVKEGYTFSGWSGIPETMPAHDVTVTGSFTINKYKLTYMVDGAEYKSMEVEFGATITPEAEPVKEGYTFSGWSGIPETMPAHDVTVTGSFTINKYKLTYMVDGTEYKSLDVEYGTTITPEAEPTKEGYTFSGWSLIPETMPAHDVTVTGTFTKGKYKLTYLVDDEVYKVISYDFGDKITPEAAPQKDGHTFSGWSEIPETMPAHDVTVTGSFSVNKYRLTYMVDGAEYKSFEVEYGTKIIPETEPTKEGYTFSGWSWIPNKMPAEDVVVTGYFTVNKYTLTYIVDDAEYKSFEIEFGAKIIPEAEPIKEGYTFSGWSEIPEIMPAHNVTVTGTFTKGNYKLTYMIDDEVYKVISYDFGDKITPEEEPSKEGYTFSGWSEIPETMPAHDVTVTGSFTVNKYKLTYVVDGTEYKSLEVEYGTTITPEAEPTKEGYTFSSWSEIPETMPAHDVTITGSFTVNKYKLTYVVDGAEYKSLEVEYGTTITPEAEPTKEGYTFSGWSEIPETMPAHDVTVTGTFVENEKEKTFDVDGIIYAITSENTVTLISGEGAQGDYEIPQTVTFDGVTYTVTAIGDSAFKDNKDITQLTIPDNIEQIGGNAFDGCSRLQTIYIGKGVREIGSKAFANIGTEASGLQVYCYPDVIPVTAIDAFENTPISSATLNVVDELVDIYKATRPWMDFGNISGLSNVGISNVYGDATDVEVFNLQGHKMNHLRKGLNIIRHKNGTTSKVIVR